MRAPSDGGLPVVDWMPVQITRVNQPAIEPLFPLAVTPVRWKPTQAMMWYCAFDPLPPSVS